MKGSATQPIATEKQELLLKIKENLREEVLAGIENMGLRESMINEYREIAGAAGQLLGLLQQYNFVNLLHNNDVAAYDQLMQRLSMSGLRCHILVEESRSVDNEALLAMAPTVSARIN
ncbi:MAG: hypothetical protein AB7E47_12510 [Desulfovibrionaceae bacterium]